MPRCCEGEDVDIAGNALRADAHADVTEVPLSAVGSNAGAVTCISVHCCIVARGLALEWNFLWDFSSFSTQRLNVAVTRAKALTIIARFH